MKNHKKLIFRIIILVSLLVILMFIISLNLNISLKIIVEDYNQYANEINKYTDEYDYGYDIYFLDHINEEAMQISSNLITKVDYNTLDEEIINIKDLSNIIRDKKIIVYNYEKIKNQQSKGYFIYLFTQAIEYMISNKYDISISNLESIYEEPIMPRFAYAEMTKFLNYYFENKNDDYLKYAKHYYSLYTSAQGEYSGYDEYSKNYITLNVRGYCQYIVYRLFNGGNNAKALNDLLGYYDYYKSYYGEVIPKYLEGDYAPAFVLFLMDYKEKEVNINDSYLDIYFSKVESKKIDDDLNSLQIVKTYYQNLYNMQKELVDSFDEQLNEKEIKVICKTSKIEVKQVNNYATINNEKHGGYVQLLNGTFKLIFDEDSFVELKDTNVIVYQDMSTIIFYLEESEDLKQALSNEIFNYSINDLIIINSCLYYYNESLKEITINEEN